MEGKNKKRKKKKKMKKTNSENETNMDANKKRAPIRKAERKYAGEQTRAGLSICASV